MEKKYYGDAYFYRCKKCQRQVIGKKYYALYELAEMGAAKRAGLITYKCTYTDCGAEFRSNQMFTNGDVVEVSKDEALASGIVFESKGQA
jgi:DNA-directed RNA polymerase subunit RPC12/RpoP